MKKWNALLGLGVLLIAVACVTINVYFPAASAERAAEKFVDDVLGEPQTEGRLFEPATPVGEGLLWAAVGVVNFLIADAQAQDAQIDINTPQINAIKARMAQRQRDSLNALFDAGAVGFTKDGFVAVRDRAAVPLSERRSLEGLVADENRDRAAVYREIAVANGHPEWEDNIQQTFAREWGKSARSGWYYQDNNGQWQQK